MNQSPEAFLARMPAALRTDVGDARLVVIFKNALRGREVMLCALMMMMVPEGSSKYVLLENHANNLNMELGMTINPAATALIERLGPQMSPDLRKMYRRCLKVISDDMAKKIQKEWDEVSNVMQ